MVLKIANACRTNFPNKIGLTKIGHETGPSPGGHVVQKILHPK